MQGTWVWTLVREPTPHMPQGQKTKTIQQEQYCNKFNKDFRNSPSNLKKEKQTAVWSRKAGYLESRSWPGVKRLITRKTINRQPACVLLAKIMYHQGLCSRLNNLNHTSMYECNPIWQKWLQMRLKLRTMRWEDYPGYLVSPKCNDKCSYKHQAEGDWTKENKAK